MAAGDTTACSTPFIQLGLQSTAVTHYMRLIGTTVFGLSLCEGKPAGPDTRPPCERARGYGQGGRVAVYGHEGETFVRGLFPAAPHQIRFLAASRPQTTDMPPCLRRASSIPNRSPRW